MLIAPQILLLLPVLILLLLSSLTSPGDENHDQVLSSQQMETISHTSFLSYIRLNFFRVTTIQ